MANLKKERKRSYSVIGLLLLLYTDCHLFLIMFKLLVLLVDVGQLLNKHQKVYPRDSEALIQGLGLLISGNRSH